MGAPQIIHELVEKFKNAEFQYKRMGFNETQTRIEFINPFFEALGWDMSNRSGKPEHFRDVVHEDKVKEKGLTKSPDYGFRISGNRLFFVEAKKPNEDIGKNARHAYQLRRYAWSAKLALSILTDFEELAVYDCTVQPKETDGPHVARAIYYKYSDYIAKWDEIYNLFSKEAVMSGSLLKYSEKLLSKKGNLEVDEVFLREMEDWRKLLAENIYKNNPNLPMRKLREAVQQTIDRIIFLRICEDRAIEEYGTLQKLLNFNDVYPALRQIFLRADDKYNSGLFRFKPDRNSQDTDEWTLELKIDDKTLKNIIERLYYPKSPYEFSVITADILGQVYERFLGKAIELTPKGKLDIELKPEVRKAGGVYYTPKYIVDYIVQNTVGEALKGKSAKDAAEIRILDPACGSGSFLLGAYQYLLDWHLNEYMKDAANIYCKSKGAVLDRTEEGYALALEEKKRILTNNIYGVDIDAQAVEVTKLSLMLKALEGQNVTGLTRQATAFSHRILPNMDNNIKCGNSLIDHSFYRGKDSQLFSEDETYKINAFDWKDEFPEVFGKHGGFHAVIGNPPYVRNTLLPSLQKVYFKNYYKSAYEQYDLYYLFFELGLKVLNSNGLLHYISPIAYLNNLSGRMLRHILLSNNLIEIVDVSNDNVFKSAATYPGLTLISKQSITTSISIKDINDIINDKKGNSIEIKPNYFNSENNIINILVGDDFHKLEEKLKSLCFNLGECFETTRGMQINKIEVFKNKVDNSYPAIHLKDCKRWLSLPSKYHVTYDKKNIAKKLEVFNNPMIIVPRFVLDFYCSYTKSDFVLDNIYIIYNESTYDLRFLSGILNSSVISYYYKHKFSQTHINGGYFAINGEQLKQLPIRKIDFSDPNDVKKHDELVKLVETMLDLNKALAKADGNKEHIRRQIKYTDHEIDRLVYELYELSEEEIGIVEGREVEVEEVILPRFRIH